MKSPKEQLRDAKRRNRKRKQTDAEKQVKSAKREARKKRKRARRRKFCGLLQGRGVPCPEPEHMFHDSRKWRLDFAWVEHKVAVEEHGGVWTRGRHTRGQGFINDREKMNEAQLLGWIVLEVTTDQFLKEVTIEWVAKAIQIQKSAQCASG